MAIFLRAFRSGGRYLISCQCRLRIRPYRGLIPMKAVIAAVGERVAQNASTWVGKGAAIISYPIDFGETANVVATNYFTEDWSGPWVKPVSFSKIAEEYSQFTGPAQAMVKLLDNPQTAAWSLWDHGAAPTYTRGAIAMMGDAAHATVPFQAQGAAQAIEDALLLGRLFAAVDAPSQIPLAFQAYDKIRRPRTQKVCETSREAGQLMTLQHPPVMDDPVKFKANAESRMHWIWDRDFELETEHALMIFKKLVALGASDPEIKLV